MQQRAKFGRRMRRIAVGVSVPLGSAERRFATAIVRETVGAFGAN